VTADSELRHLGEDVRASWQRFLSTFEALRPALYRYCRHLTGTPWDAEDLAQDTMTRAFVTLGTSFSALPEPRAWLFRVASNAWIDRARRERSAASSAHPPEASTFPEPQSTREAAGTLFALLSPQERVALVLKEAFDFSLDEIAIVLGTTTGAVKASLSRGRARLEAGAPQRAERIPERGVLEAFANAFNARDLGQLTALLLSTASVEIVGVVTEYGRDAPKDPLTGSFAGTLTPITIDERGGVPSELLEGYLGRAPRCEVRAYRDTWLLLFWYDHADGPFVRTLMRLETEEGQISRVQNYFFSPSVLAEVCLELGVAHRVNGYRYWGVNALRPAPP
jgi:RNA polymerase sigma-70 factor, ECF subfamily